MGRAFYFLSAVSISIWTLGMKQRQIAIKCVFVRERFVHAVMCVFLFIQWEKAIASEKLKLNTDSQGGEIETLRWRPRMKRGLCHLFTRFVVLALDSLIEWSKLGEHSWIAEHTLEHKHHDSIYWIFRALGCEGMRRTTAIWHNLPGLYQAPTFDSLKSWLCHLLHHFINQRCHDYKKNIKLVQCLLCITFSELGAMCFKKSKNYKWQNLCGAMAQSTGIHSAFIELQTRQNDGLTFEIGEIGVLQL